jgi:hypothetical protein
VKFLLAYLFVVFVIGLRAERRKREVPVWHLLVPAMVVSASFLSQRFL